MKKVAEYLDKYFYYKLDGSRSSNINKKGEFGDWIYPQNPKMVKTEIPIFIEKDNEMVYTSEFQKTTYTSIRCLCNNQTIRFLIKIKGVYQKCYGYLQTYDHIPRGAPDEQGYYARSTDEEVIRYIKIFKNKIDRELKLERILNIK
jgi:hypothetical protein